MSSASFVQSPFPLTPELVIAISGDKTIKATCELLATAPLASHANESLDEDPMEDPEWPNSITPLRFANPYLEMVFAESPPALVSSTARLSCSAHTAQIIEKALGAGEVYLNPNGEVGMGTDILHKTLTVDASANWLPPSIKDWISSIPQARSLSQIEAKALIRVHPTDDNSSEQIIDYGDLAHLGQSLAAVPPRESWKLTMSDDTKNREFIVEYECDWDLGNQSFILRCWDDSVASQQGMQTDVSGGESDYQSEIETPSVEDNRPRRDLLTSLVISGSITFKYTDEEVNNQRYAVGFVPTSSGAAAAAVTASSV